MCAATETDVAECAVHLKQVENRCVTCGLSFAFPQCEGGGARKGCSLCIVMILDI